MSVLQGLDIVPARLVLAVLGGALVRASKIAVAAVLAEAVDGLVPANQVYSVERAVLPVLPSVEVIGVTSERQESGPLNRHELSIECTVSHPSEDGADEALDAIVAAIRGRLCEAETGIDPVVLPSGAVAVLELQGTRWSVSAGSASSVIRGSAISLAVAVDE